MKNNLNVYACIENLEDLKAAFEHVDINSPDNILYLDCSSTFKIGNRSVENVAFDGCFYSENNNIIILFTKGNLKHKDIRTFLEKANIKHTVIRFKNNSGKKIDYSKIDRIWFAKDELGLTTAIDNSMKKGIKECEFNSQQESSLSLEYYSDDEEPVIYPIDGILCKGIVALEDKIVLLTNQEDKNELSQEEVIRILEEKGMKVRSVSRPRR